MLQYEDDQEWKYDGPHLRLAVVNAGSTPGLYDPGDQDNAYKATRADRKALGYDPGTEQGHKPMIILDPLANGGWYDYSILVDGAGSFEKRYAGRVETGKESTSDPAMG